MTRPTRIVVAGGAGFIGSHVVELIDAEGCRVLVVDDMSHPADAEVAARVDVLVADAGSAYAADAIARFRPDVALNLAARGGVARALAAPAAHVRSVLASVVGFYSAAAAAGARAIVSASSGGAIYGDPAALPATEATPPAPRSPYGAEKLAEEGYLAALGRTAGIRTLALRFSNVYGPRQDGTGEAGVVAITCQRLLDGLAPLIYGDGLQMRDFVHVHDVARATLAGLRSDADGVLNVGTNRSTTVASVVSTLCRAAGYSGPVEYSDGKPGEVRQVRLDISLIGRALGWEPSVSIDDGLCSSYAWFEDHGDASDVDVRRASA